MCAKVMIELEERKKLNVEQIFFGNMVNSN